jgi:hypothetical protein
MNLDEFVVFVDDIVEYLEQRRVECVPGSNVPPPIAQSVELALSSAVNQLQSHRDRALGVVHDRARAAT